jgi:hypothetical protein
LPPSSARSSLADLTPASGCQDHTPSRPPRRRSSARKLARVAKASIATRLTFGDDWPKRPLPSRRDADTILLIYRIRKGKYFFARGWTRFSQGDPSGKSVWKRRGHYGPGRVCLGPKAKELTTSTANLLHRCELMYRRCCASVARGQMRTFVIALAALD